MALARVVQVDPANPERKLVLTAVDTLRRGGIVAFPTETVYGLGAHALDEHAVRRVFHAKGRPFHDPVIVHLATVDDLHHVVRRIPTEVSRLAAAFWPGPLTLILERSPEVPSVVSAGLSTIAVRVPAHPVAQLFLQVAAVPVAAPSANRFSRPSPTEASHVLTDLGESIDFVIDGGPATIGVESTILDLTTSRPTVRRAGAVTLRDLKRVLPMVDTHTPLMTTTRALAAPGQLRRHYAPRAAMTLYVGSLADASDRVGEDVRSAVASGKRVGILAPEEDLLVLAPRIAAVSVRGRVVVQPYGSRRDRAAAAHALFRALRLLDAEETDVIMAVAADGRGLDEAIVDRLTRGAEGRVVRC